ncbi:MAG: hypothetical protein ABUL61_06630, partial [Oleiharenicola lentus]
LALGAAAVIFWPRCARAARVAGLAFVLGGAYLTVVARAPWYFPAWQVLAYIAVGGGAVAGLEVLQARRVWRRALLALVVLAGVAQGAMFVAVATELREQQRIIEWGLRAPLGRALRAAARPTDTVFLESLGYIGFYSNLAMRDTPGLSAPEVVALRRQGAWSMPLLISALRPDWVVLRPGEYAIFSPAEVQALDRDYQLQAIHDVRPAVNDVAWLPGRGFLLSDAHYVVWRRRPAGGRPAP